MKAHVHTEITSAYVWIFRFFCRWPMRLKGKKRKLKSS